MGNRKFANLLSAAGELASSEMRREKETKYRLDLKPIIAKVLATYVSAIHLIYFDVVTSCSI